jgi:hypothetical protein
MHITGRQGQCPEAHLKRDLHHLSAATKQLRISFQIAA